MSEEEILRVYADKACNYVPEDSMVISFEDTITLIEKESILFSEWASRNATLNCLNGEILWDYGSDDDVLTSQQLYQLYKESQQTKTS